MDRFTEAPSQGVIDPAVLPAGMDDARRVKVMVQLSEPSVAEVEAQRGTELSKGQRKQIARDLRAQQAGVVSAAKAEGGTVLAQTQYALNGVKVSIARKDVAALAQQQGVKAVLPVATYELDNATAVPYLGVPQVWQDTGYTGEGVKVAIIDTGIDYTHADFGGPGTVEAYEEADANDTTAGDSPFFGPDAPRVKGGYDFVGDAYDAGEDGSVPVPDEDPLDCQGHGSHVAGSAAGSGVTADGSTYTGPYDSSTAEQDWLIGPGVAPEADLYALRVFGCAGSTDVTVEAIEWAVANDMDVINMSLGSPYGLRDDASAIASRNAAAAGVVVVASAGNSGPSPYITGAPGAGDGVISVAATDSTATYPGVSINLDGSSIDAITANGVYPVDGAEHEIVVLENIEGTAENEALGCSTEAFTANGITEGGNQLAVTVRGTCARVARAVFGQQAGAGAVVMINSTDDLPPFEGPITENPDDGVAYEVTIPFLGVRASDGPALRAAEGQTVTYEEKALQNPGFTRAASFSSGGPRNGDSHLKPSVAAPGVAIDSAAVGTGSKGQRMSGTSMAAPMVAGVAALGVQAHPEWSGLEVSSAIVTTADRDEVGGYRLTLTGNGLVDAMQTVTTDVVAYGDALVDGDPGQMLPTLSFGFEESAARFNATKKVTLVNKGDTARTYQVSAVASPQSTPASVTVSPSSVTVAPGSTADVTVKLSASASDVPSSMSGGHHSFYEISGQVRLTSDAGDLNVPYLLVPRSIASGDVKGSPINLRKGGTTATLVNKGGALPAAMDFYTWGLEDAQDVTTTGNSGYDLRAAGVQSFGMANGDTMLVFAINNWDRWSNAASLEHDILIDVNGDGAPDKAVFVLDYGLVAAGSADGTNAVFVQDLATGALSVRYFATSPTDSSTVLAPVLASQLGLVEGSSIGYQVASWDLTGNGFDSMPGTAVYNPWEKALSTDGEYVEVAPGASVKMDVSVDRAAWEAQKPLGVMAVVLDNAAGEDEAILLGGR